MINLSNRTDLWQFIQEYNDRPQDFSAKSDEIAE